MANVFAFALVGNIGCDDAAQHVGFAASVAAFSHNLIRILVVIPSIEYQIESTLPSQLELSIFLKPIHVLEIELKDSVIRQHPLEEHIH